MKSKLKKQEQCYENCLALLKQYGLQTRANVIKIKTNYCEFFINETFVVIFTLWVNKGKFKKYLGGGYRENVRFFSSEFTFKKKKKIVRVDVDYGNPWYDLPGTFRHLGELFCNYVLSKKTDPFKVAEGLRARGIDVADVRRKERKENK